MRPLLSLLAALLAALAPAAASASKATVCTITVNSADEREAFREHLPADRYEFVELAEMGRRDWLGEACRKQVRCDVLVVSGHFAGTQFYSSKHGEHLPVDEMERVACSDSCPGLFSQLKEVYLFGCDTLKPEAVRSATPEVVRGLQRAGMNAAAAARLARELSELHGESARGRMRRIFAGVPLVYGFASLAPYGRVAGPMLRRHFEANGAGHVGSGSANAKLLALFGPASMVATSGQLAGDADAAYRAEACRYHDDRLDDAQRIAFLHGVLAGPAPAARMAFDRIEKFVASLDERARAEPAMAAALERIAADVAGRGRWLALTRETEDVALRVRMVALARALGWLDQAGERREHIAAIADVLAAGKADFGEVDLICGLNGDGGLDGEAARLEPHARASQPPAAAALACLGSGTARERMLRALASAHEAEVQVAHAYFRHRPISDAAELRGVVRAIAAMREPVPQARALAVVARHHVDDAETLEVLTGLFARSTHHAVQRAVAEIFMRAGPAVREAPGLAGVLRRHRVRAGDSDELFESLLRRLEGGAREG